MARHFATMRRIIKVARSVVYMYEPFSGGPVPRLWRTRWATMHKPARLSCRNAKPWNSTWSSWGRAAGLSAAIRLKELAAEKGTEISVVVLEKGSEVGAHILSGAVIDPIGLELTPSQLAGRGRARERSTSPRTAFSISGPMATFTYPIS